MKKNWKIIVGVILIVGGIGLAATDLFSGAIDIAVGIVLVVWWKLGRKRPSNRSPRSVAPPPPAVRAKQAGTSPAAKQEEKGYDILIPEKKDGAPLAYRYSVPFVPSDLDAVLVAAKAERWYLTAKQIGGEIHLFSEDADLGVLTERADMVSDWLRRGEPHIIILERVNSETGCTVMLVFYRDKQKYNAHREQTVVALTGYKGEEKQEQLLYLNPGDELELAEDYEKEGCVLVLSHGSELGYLPKKYAGRFLEEGAALIVFDHEEPVEDSDISKPFVKIYW